MRPVYRMNLRKYNIVLFISFLILYSRSHGLITIGHGPVIGTDHAGNTYYEEFQDWNYGDLRALDQNGPSDMYLYYDGYDNSRDIIAFYSRQEGANYYFRVDLYDLTSSAENGYLDLYVLINFKPGGTSQLPNSLAGSSGSVVTTDHPWNLAVAVYDSVNYAVFLSPSSTINSTYLGSYFNNQLDAVEFGISTTALAMAGWNGTDTLYFQVLSAKDETNPYYITDAIGDDDRGFSAPHALHGAFASNASTGRAKYAAIAHGNQSINQASGIQTQIWDPTTVNKTGYIRTLDTFEIFKQPLNIHPSGSFLVACNWAKSSVGSSDPSDGPTFLNNIKQFINPAQTTPAGSIIGGVFAEQIMPYFEGAANTTSMALFNEVSQNILGQSISNMSVMHVPERVIRSYPTGLSPLTGFTFADITAGGFQATYLDEVSHLHWWFYAGESVYGWSGYQGNFDTTYQHKIHKINGVYCFMINDREDQEKFGPYDNGLNLDTRYTLLNKAMQSDQAQLTLVFDDWEAYAGKSFDPISGQSSENNNQMQYQETLRWIANHPWIEVVNLKDILSRALDSTNPQYNPTWIIDHGTSTTLSIQTYEWLKHASEESFHNWFYDSNAGVTGNEQNFYGLVPVVLGPQGNYWNRGIGGNPSSPSLYDGPSIPSGKTIGDLNSPNTLFHDTWAELTAAPENSLKKLAEYEYMAMIYETAWHEEDNGNYSNTTYQNPFPDPDVTWDGVNTWELQLANHVRNVGVLVDAANWVNDCNLGSQSSTTQIIFEDLNQEGQNQYVMKNNHVYACFEKYGGRMVNAFIYDSSTQDAISVIGSPASDPSAPGEEEYTGTAANRCSALKDMNNGYYADTTYTVSTASTSLILTSIDGKISKTVNLANGADMFNVTYNQSLSGSLYVRVGASPNNLDLILNGRTHLSDDSTAHYYGVKNSQGGAVYVTLNGGATYNPTPLYSGYQNRNIALTEEIEIFGSNTFSFNILFSPSEVPVRDWWLY